MNRQALYYLLIFYIARLGNCTEEVPAHTNKRKFAELSDSLVAAPYIHRRTVHASMESSPYHVSSSSASDLIHTSHEQTPSTDLASRSINHISNMPNVHILYPQISFAAPAEDGVKDTSKDPSHSVEKYSYQEVLQELGAFVEHSISTSLASQIINSGCKYTPSTSKAANPTMNITGNPTVPNTPNTSTVLPYTTNRISFELSIFNFKESNGMDLHLDIIRESLRCHAPQIILITFVRQLNRAVINPVKYYSQIFKPLRSIIVEKIVQNVLLHPLIFVFAHYRLVTSPILGQILEEHIDLLSASVGFVLINLSPDAVLSVMDNLVVNNATVHIVKYRMLTDYKYPLYKIARHIPKHITLKCLSIQTGIQYYGNTGDTSECLELPSKVLKNVVPHNAKSIRIKKYSVTQSNIINLGETYKNRISLFVPVNLYNLKNLEISENLWSTHRELILVGNFNLETLTIKLVLDRYNRFTQEIIRSMLMYETYNLLNMLKWISVVSLFGTDNHYTFLEQEILEWYRNKDISFLHSTTLLTPQDLADLIKRSYIFGHHMYTHVIDTLVFKIINTPKDTDEEWRCTLESQLNHVINTYKTTQVTFTEQCSLNKISIQLFPSNTLDIIQVKCLTH